MILFMHQQTYIKQRGVGEGQPETYTKRNQTRSHVSVVEMRSGSRILNPPDESKRNGNKTVSQYDRQEIQGAVAGDCPMHTDALQKLGRLRAGITNGTGSLRCRRFHLAVHARQLGDVAWCRRECVEAGELEDSREGIRRGDLIVGSGPLDRALAHGLCVHDGRGVVVECTVNCHAIAVKGLSDETVRRHLGGGEVLEWNDRHVEPLGVSVLLGTTNEA